MIRTVDIIGLFVAGLTPTVEVKSVASGPDNTQILSVCNTFHLTIGKTITIDGDPFEVLDVVVQTETAEGKITIADDPAVSAPTTFVLEAPRYDFGNAIDVNAELILQPLGVLKFPLVYLASPFPEGNDRTRGARIIKTPTMNIYFLAEQNFNGLIADHYKNAVKPMQNLSEQLLNAFDKSDRVGKLTNNTTTDGVHFGVKRDAKRGELDGRVVSSTFDDSLSGVHLNISLPLTKNCLNLEC